MASRISDLFVMMPHKDLKIGGQAVIEGIMVRSPHTMTVAVRRPTGEIVMRADDLTLLSDRWPFLKLPFFRGTVTLFSTLFLGIRALNYSAQQALDEEEGEIGGWTMGLTMAAAFGLAIVLFLLLPLWLTHLLQGPFGWVRGQVGFNLVDGVFRLAVFLAYLGAISMAKDVRRIFEYHGAEHKTIHALEAGEELTVQNARRHSPLHPRCGTSLLLIVMVLSILLFAQIPQAWPFWAKALSRVVLIPVLAGLSYEILKLGDRYRDSRFLGILVAPGLFLQRITTKEPSDDQIEVAIVAVREALAREEGRAP